MEKIQQTHLDRRFRLLGFVLLQCFVSRILAVGDEDLITDLPGVTFDYDFKQYSGYLNANSDGTHRLFYWLTESANSPDTDPLLIWFNGGTGFSYDTNDPDTLLAGDDETAAGESYAAIYITTLSNLIFQSIARRQFPNSNFQGIAIGNGYLNAKNLTNSLVHWHLYHGTIGVRQWEDIRNGCCRGIKRIEDCDFSAHIAENTTDTWPLTDCGRLFVDAMIVPDNNVICTQNYFNYDSTDNQNGFNCWNEQAMAIYLNRPDVQKALHISSHWMSNENTQWELCKDTVCNFIGAAWFTENLAQKERMAASKRVAWRFRNQLAGFFQPYKLTISRGNTLTLDVLTIKAAGHFANDRPGPALQMITNFVRGSGNYSDDRHIDVSPQPRDLKSNAQSANYFTIFPLLCLSSLTMETSELQSTDYKRTVYGWLYRLFFGTIVLNRQSAKPTQASRSLVQKLRSVIPAVIIALIFLIRVGFLFNQLKRPAPLTYGWAFSLATLLLTVHGLISTIILAKWNASNLLNEFPRQLYAILRNKIKGINNAAYRKGHILQTAFFTFFLLTFFYVTMENWINYDTHEPKSNITTYRSHSDLLNNYGQRHLELLKVYKSANDQLGGFATATLMLGSVIHVSMVFVMRSHVEDLTNFQKLHCFLYLLLSVFYLLITIKLPAGLHSKLNDTKQIILFETRDNSDIKLNSVVTSFIQRINECDYQLVVFDGLKFQPLSFHKFFMLYPMIVEVLNLLKP
ncbi:Carboxypeptidase [Aphelenchoides besseyi]|nr:Carboxypeptidase [Aphelenchoides besseyi]